MDLTNATDRFPIDLIADVLRGALTPTYVEAWRNVMVGFPFTIPSRLRKEGDPSEVSYSVGNPMGFYSSWGSFALAHHFVVYWCCQDLGIPWGTARYVLLGDDILIGDPRLGELYQKRILSLGIEVSPQKTYVSTEVCEFAKRYLYRGEEVTPFPISAVQRNLGDISLMVSAIMGESRKGFVPSSGIPECVAGLIKRLGGRAAYARKCALRAHDAELATLLFQRVIDPVEFVLRTSRVSDPAAFDALQSYGLEVLSAAVRSLIQRGLESKSPSLEKALYEDLYKMVSALQSCGVPGHYAFLAPAFGAYNEFEEAVERIHSLGFTALSDSSDLLEIIGEVVVDPLSETSWGLSRRQRQVRAHSRLARACRDLGQVVQVGGDVSAFGRYAPPMPMKETLRYWVKTQA